MATSVTFMFIRMERHIDPDGLWPALFVRWILMRWSRSARHRASQRRRWRSCATATLVICGRDEAQFKHNIAAANPKLAVEERARPDRMNQAAGNLPTGVTLSPRMAIQRGGFGDRSDRRRDRFSCPAPKVGAHKVVNHERVRHVGDLRKSARAGAVEWRILKARP
jgi:hypothetical protein